MIKMKNVCKQSLKSIQIYNYDLYRMDFNNWISFVVLIYDVLNCFFVYFIKQIGIILYFIVLS